MNNQLQEARKRIERYIAAYEDAPNWGGPTTYPAAPSIADLKALLAFASHPQPEVTRIYVRWSDDGERIRKWSREPFAEGEPVDAIGEPVNELAARVAAYAETCTGLEPRRILREAATSLRQRPVAVDREADAGEPVKWEGPAYEYGVIWGPSEPTEREVQWSNIDGAPQDGSEIDLWSAHTGTRYADARWSSKRDCWEVWGLDGMDRMDWVRVDSRPTHWLLVPEGPEL